MGKFKIKGLIGIFQYLLVFGSVSVIALISIGQSSQAEQIKLPELGDSAEGVLSVAREQAIGHQLMRQIRQRKLLVDDLIVQEYINTIGQAIASHADDPIHRLQFFVMADRAVNAFAMPGGYIGINAGLIEMTENESELAAVIAHEIAHVTQRHIPMAFAHQQHMQPSMMAAIIAGVLLGGEAGRATAAAAGAGMAQSSINFTRKNEKDADRIGIALLSRSGFNTRSMAGFFEKMQRQAKLYGRGIPEFLSTHPVHSSRVAEARSRADRHPNSQPSDSTLYQLTKARLTVLLQPDLRQTAVDLTKALKSAQASDEAIGRYALALALMESGQLSKASREINQAIALDETNRFFLLLRGQIQFRQGNRDQAVLQVKKLWERYSDDYIVALEYAQMLIQVGQATTAKEVLQRYRAFRQDDARLYALLANASIADGDPMRSHSYMAKYHRLQGEFEKAIGHVKRALRLTGGNYYQEARLQALLADLKQKQNDTKAVVN